MNKIASLLTVLALTFLVVPVAGVAFPGCAESSPNVDCNVAANQQVPNTLVNPVFQYRLFSIQPGVQVTVQPSATVTPNGGNITIIAKQLDIGGTITVDGASSNPNWALNGGNGGLITLIAKQRLFFGINSVLNARGGDGIVSSCSGGNGGNGGSISLRTVSGAAVSLFGRLNASSGQGAIPPASCNATNGTVGQAGQVETNGVFTPSVVDFSISGGSTNFTSGNNAVVTLSAVDEFGDDIIPTSTLWTTSNSSIVNLVSSNSTLVNVTAVRAGNTTVNATISNIEKNVGFTVYPGEFDHITVNTTFGPTLRYNDVEIVEIRSFDLNGNPVLIPQSRYGDIKFEFLEDGDRSEGELVSCLLQPPCVPDNGVYLVGVLSTELPGNMVLRITHGSQVFDLPFTVIMGEVYVRAIRIEPQNSTAAIGSTLNFSVIGIDQRGFEATFPAYAWTATNLTGSGSIDSNGTFTPATLGVVNITGKLGNRYNWTLVNVTLGQPSYVNVTGQTSVVAGEQAQFNVSLHDVNGNVLSINGQIPTYVWTTSSGTMYPNGTLVAIKTGTVTVTATLVQNQNLRRSVDIYVTPGAVSSLVIAEAGGAVEAGSIAALNALLVDRFGNPVAPTDASWTILNGTGQATLNGRLITGTKAGYVNVYASAVSNSSLAGSGVITIVPSVPVSIKIKPVGASVRPSSTVAFTVDAFDAFDNKYSLSNVSWNVSNSGVASINSNGVLTALSPGSTGVTATVTGLSVSDTVTVQVLEPLETQSQQLAAPLLGAIPGVTIPAEFPRISINTDGTASGLAGGLTGLFTAETIDLQWLLIGGLALLLIGLVAYYASGRR